MEMKLTLNGVEQTITNQQLYDLAAKGMIGPETVVTVNGKPFYAGQAQGIVFGQPRQASTSSVTPPSPVTMAGPENMTPRKGITPSKQMLLHVGIPLGIILLIIMTFVLIPAFQWGIETAQMKKCSDQFKKISIAFHEFHDKYDALPALYTIDKNGVPLHSWRVLLLPYIGEEELYKKIRLDEPWDSPHNKQFHSKTPKLFSCPANKLCTSDKSCCCSAIAGDGFDHEGKNKIPNRKAAFSPAQQSKEITGTGLGGMVDGTSDTMFCIEVKEPFCWMNPMADVTFDELIKGVNVTDGRVGSFHAKLHDVSEKTVPVKGCFVAMGDGSIRFFT